MLTVGTDSTSIRAENQPRKIRATPVYDVLQLHKLGYWVAPIQPGTKHRIPGCRSKDFERLTTAKIRSTWQHTTSHLYHNVGILTGVDGLVVRDFDDRAAYCRWYEQNHEIARNLPMAKTRRGVHVYARLETVPAATKITCFAGELICHDIVMAPPSYLEDRDFSYTWIRSPAELASIPIVLPEQLHVDLGVSLHDVTTVRTVPTVSTVRCFADTASQYSADTLHEIRGVIEKNGVSGPGETNRVRFALARELRRVAKEAGIMPTQAQVSDWAGQWFDLHSHAMGNPDWAEVRAKFLHAYQAVKFVAGDGLREAAIEHVDQVGARHIEHPLLSRCNHRIHTLAAVMRAMSQLSGGEFFLSTRDAAKACGYVSDDATITHLNTASRRMSDWLRLLEDAGCIRCVQRGSPGRGTDASTFVWTGPEE